MTSPATRTKLNWFGKNIELEFFADTKFEGRELITQIQAVFFINQDQIVLYKSGRGNYGCPGGHRKEGESWMETLKREIREEISAEVIECGSIGYLRERNLATNEIKYFLRYWTLVRLLDEQINDSDDEKRERFVFSISEAIEKLAWGNIDQVLVKLAEQEFRFQAEPKGLLKMKRKG